jgi:soluble lytic murein transglycosylase-like protein
MSWLRSRSTAGSVLLALLLAAASLQSARADEVIDRVLAVVAGDLIMQSDLRAARELGLVATGDAADPDRAVLSQLIDRALMLDEVERYAPPEPAADAIERAYRAVRARFASDEIFAIALGRVGFDEKQLRAVLRQNLRIRAYLDQRFGGETPERGEAIIAAWVAGLRSRAPIIDLYVPPPSK